MKLPQNGELNGFSSFRNLKLQSKKTLLLYIIEYFFVVEHAWWGWRTHELHPDGHPVRPEDGRRYRRRRNHHQVLRGLRDERPDRRRGLQTLPHDLRQQVLRLRGRRCLRRVPDRRWHDRRRSPQGTHVLQVNRDQQQHTTDLLRSACPSFWKNCNIYFFVKKIFSNLNIM